MAIADKRGLGNNCFGRDFSLVAVDSDADIIIRPLGLPLHVRVRVSPKVCVGKLSRP